MSRIIEGEKRLLCKIGIHKYKEEEVYSIVFKNVSTKRYEEQCIHCGICKEGSEFFIECGKKLKT